MNLILLGAPGAGKGTQASRIAPKYGIPHISTGDIFRQEMAKKSDLGSQVESYVKSGRLVPDHLATQVVVQRLGQPDCRHGFLLDGFPRTVAQAEVLDRFLTADNRPLTSVLFLKLEEAEVINRVSSRRQCERCGAVYNLVTQPPRHAELCDTCGGKLIQREDDKAETVKKRLLVYDDLTEPLIAYYHALGVLETVDAGRPVDEVFAAVVKVLDPLSRK